MADQNRASPLDLSDTIVAVATAPGRGALAIVRVSGPRAHAIVRATLDRWPDGPRSVVVSLLRDGSGTALDQVVVTRYDAPASYTGEDAVELVTHGGSVVSATVSAALVARGARLAAPGEFTRRAVLNGKMDVLQAEATADLVDARSRAAQSVALRQLDGGLSRRVLELRSQLIELEALIAYDIDFPEEDDGPIAPARIGAAAERVTAALDRLLATSNTGELVRHGALVVLAGAPNVGKSSLFNALLGESRAIVTDIPGTTRDAIEAVIDTTGVPLRLVDTAGLREATDIVERLGVEVSGSYVARAAIVLACGDDAESMRAIGTGLLARTRAAVVAVRTKADLATVSDTELRSAKEAVGARAAIAVSAERGDGLEDLVDLIQSIITEGDVVTDLDAPILTQERHRFAIGRAREEVGEFRERWQRGDVPVPVAAVHLHDAVAALEELIGAVDVEHVLDEVFRRFCVGK
jgi:tRNA modification GTPase